MTLITFTGNHPLILIYLRPRKCVTLFKDKKFLYLSIWFFYYTKRISVHQQLTDWILSSDVERPRLLEGIRLWDSLFLLPGSNKLIRNLPFLIDDYLIYLLPSQLPSLLPFPYLSRVSQLSSPIWQTHKYWVVFKRIRLLKVCSGETLVPSCSIFVRC